MEPIAIHANFRQVRDRVIAPGPGEQRRAARAVLGAARPFALLAFRVADTHVHVLVAGDAAVEAVRRVKIALQGVLRPGSGFTPAHHEPVMDQRHLERAFRYVLRQSDHHGFGHDPQAECSNLPDLLGMRLLGGWTVRHVRRRLPRLGRAALLEALGVEDRVADPAPVGLLAESAAAAAALVDLGGRGEEVVAARRAAVHAADPGANALAVAGALGLSRRSLFRLRGGEPDAALVQAVRLQADLRRRRPAGLSIVSEPAPLPYRVESSAG